MVIDQGQVSVTDLAKATGVSEVTIRQDLNTLEKLSYLRRAHGFAVSLDSDDVETRMMSNYTLKRELAEFAASLVQPGETIFIENGSSNALLARTLGEQKKNVTIITVSSYIAHLLKDAPCEVILLVTNIILSPEFMIHGSKLSITIIAKNKPGEIIP